ncbi:MAG: serine hydrolase [Deltaproteobacteria bacterium]|nr:serine hydrolase [Deltaproteobacteria bacterium]
MQGTGSLLLGWLCALPLLAHADAAPERPAAGFLTSIQASASLQGVLDEAIGELRRQDSALHEQTIRAALIDLPGEGPAQLAHWNGDSSVYPASVPKFAYLMAAYAWRDLGRLDIDTAFDRQLQAMIYHSSNSATQRVLRRLTRTEPGPRLSAEEYAQFAYRRHAVKRWLQELGIADLHLVHPTYNGGGDLHGRDVQFLEDRNVPGSLPDQTGQFRNRQAMTANGTTRLLALLAEGLALTPATSAEVLARMRRDPRRQPYLWKRIAGGADPGAGDLEVYSKTGTWGPIYADAGIVRHRSGHQLALSVFIEGTPAYRGPFIAKLTRALVSELLTEGATASGRPGSRTRPAAARG